MDIAIVSRPCLFLVALTILGSHEELRASGHGPVFGAATPTLGRGGWSIDQAYTFRGGEGDDPQSQQMLKTMVSFGITETFQVSGSVPIAMSNGLAPSRMMSAMSSEREFEALLAYRFQKRPIGIGGRQESTLYVGGTIPTESKRSGLPVGPSLVVEAATGYASRAHYAWIGGGLQHFVERDGAKHGAARFVTFVYGYRPPPMRVEPGEPDLRFFVEATVEDRTAATATRQAIRATAAMYWLPHVRPSSDRLYCWFTKPSPSRVASCFPCISVPASRASGCEWPSTSHTSFG